MTNNLYMHGALVHISFWLANGHTVEQAVQKHMQRALTKKPWWAPMPLWIKYGHWGQKYAAFAAAGKMCEILAPVDADAVDDIAEWYK